MGPKHETHSEVHTMGWSIKECAAKAALCATPDEIIPGHAQGTSLVPGRQLRIVGTPYGVSLNSRRQRLAITKHAPDGGELSRLTVGFQDGNGISGAGIRLDGVDGGAFHELNRVLATLVVRYENGSAKIMTHYCDGRVWAELTQRAAIVQELEG